MIESTDVGNKQWQAYIYHWPCGASFLWKGELTPNRVPRQEDYSWLLQHDRECELNSLTQMSAESESVGWLSIKAVGALGSHGDPVIRVCQLALGGTKVSFLINYK